MTVEHGLPPYQGEVAQQGTGQVIQGEVVVQQQYPQYAASTEVALSREQLAGLETGIDGLTVDEIPTPRLMIDHQEGAYTDNQTGAKRPEFFGIVLGFVRQRIMWPKELPEDGGSPMCKSNDAVSGLPNMDPTSEFQFPFHDSSINPNDLHPNPDLNRVLLPCANCVFTQWSGQGNKTPPRCSEVFNLVVMFDAYGTGDLQPAFFPMKKSAIGPAKKYLARFMQRNLPAYSEFAHFTLEHRMRGKNPYSVPIIKAVGPTGQEMWPAFSENYALLRDFATRIRPLDDGADTGVQQQFEAPSEQYSQSTQAPQPQAPVQAANPMPAAQQYQAPPPVYQAPQPASVQHVAQPAPVQQTPQPVPVQQMPQPIAPTPPPPPVQYQQSAPPPPVVQAPPVPAPPVPAPPVPAPPVPQPPQPVAPAAPAPAPVQAAPPVAAAPEAPAPQAPPWQAGPAAAVPDEDDGLPF